ncbi:hypothetical protein EST38_g11461, partial [Candolleomyces aberdarensis]
PPERCDAPKCHPETRVAVQDDLYSWIVDSDREPEHPKKMKWVTGPAGSGKTAVMGSLAGRCAENGVLGATFFFASWSASIGRRRKTAFVTTIARQLAECREDLKNTISAAIERNPNVFEKNLHIQMEALILAPLREVALQPDGPQLQGAIIIDGVDECEAEQYHDGSKEHAPARINEQDQLEILQVLQAAASDPSFPFHILIASRPERVFREFFDPQNNPIPIADKLDLHNDYNADADITLFLEAQFSRIRRRYNLPPSWPPPGTIQTLVENASGQFIYAATVIRFLDTGHQEPPKASLEAILKMKATGKMTSNPLKQLDALYTHILESSPDSLLSVRWIHGIHHLTVNGLLIQNTGTLRVASNINLLLQAGSDGSEAEHLLGTLHSLIRIPPPSGQATTEYDFYHKSLLDFLQDPERCKELHVQHEEFLGFLWDRFNRRCTRGCLDAHVSYPQSFLELLARVPYITNVALGSAHSEALPTRASADWWVTLAITYKEPGSLWNLFQRVHSSVRTVLNLFQTFD